MSDQTQTEHSPVGLKASALALTWLGRGVLRSLVVLRLFKVLVAHRDIVPKTGPVVIVSNHISMLDAVYLWGALRRPAVFMAMAELWERWYWRLTGVSWLMRSLGHIPVRRSSEESRRHAYDASVHALQAGLALIIYPQGGIDTPGHVRPLRSGAARAALETGAPVLVAGIHGSDRVSRLRLRQVVTTRFSSHLLDPADYPGSNGRDRLMADVQQQLSELARA